MFSCIAVNTGTLDEDSKRASLDPDYATLKASQQSHTHLHHTHMDNSVSSNGTSVTGFTVSQYEMSAASRQFSSSLVYYEVGPTCTMDETKEPQDYALPVASKHPTIDSQPYEVPVDSLHHNQSTEVKISALKSRTIP